MHYIQIGGAAMASSEYYCDVNQGFNFEKDSQVVVGHLNSLKIGEKEYTADISVGDPESVTEVVTVVGVLGNIEWQGGYADSISFSAQISTANKNLLATLVHTNLVNTEVLMEFTVYEYDPEKLAYFKCFHTNAVKLKGLIEKSGGELSIQVGTEQNSEVVSPKNFTFNLGVMPQDEDQAVHVAVSTSGKFAKKWGVAVTAS
jgi:hypothetical protein